MKSIQVSVIALFAMFSSANAYAFNPFAIAAVVSTVAQVVNSASEVAETANAFNELYSEIDNEAMVGEGGQRVISKIQEIESMANELGYTAEELNSLSHEDKEHFRKISVQLREVTRAIKAGKKLAKLVLSPEKKAQHAEIEQNQVAQQQLTVEMNQMYESQANALNGVKEELKQAVREKNQITSLRGKMRVDGVKVFAKSKTLVFPGNEAIIEAAIDLSKKIQPVLFGFMIVVIALRILFYQASFKPTNYMSVIRDATLCMLFILFIPNLVHIILACSNEFASAITKISGSHEPNIIDPKEFKVPDLGKGGILTGIFWSWVYQWFMYILYIVTETIMSLALGFMVVVMPIVIFLGVGFNVPFIWTTFLLTFSILTLWPALWNIIGMLGELVWAQDADTLKTMVYGFCASFLQIVSPFYIGRIIKGEGAHSLAKEAAQTGSQYTSSTFANSSKFGNSVMNALKGGDKNSTSSGGSGPPSIASTAGGAVGHAGNQAASRIVNFAKGFSGAGTEGGSSNVLMQAGKGLQAMAFNNSEGKTGVGALINGFKSQSLSKGSKK